MQVQQDVKLISITPNFVDVLYAAYRTCQSDQNPYDIYTDKETSQMKKISLIKKCVEAGHESPLEMIDVIYAVSNISRVVLAQITRHRLMSFAVKNQRYICDYKDFDYIIPNGLNGCEEEYQEFMAESQRFYNFLLKMDVAQDKARYVLPNATATNLIMKTNLRSLKHFLGLRLCSKTQDETINFARLLRKEVFLNDEANLLSSVLQVKCFILGYCNEMKSCGLMPHKTEVIE